MTVRAATEADAAAVAALMNAINSLDGNRPLVPMTAAIARRDLLGPSPWAEVLVAERDGAVVGFASFSPLYASERAVGGYFLIDLYVDPAHRRRGLARALMARLAALAQARGAGCVWWGVDDGDDEAMRFYDAIGAAFDGHASGRLLADAAFLALAGEAKR